MGKKKREELQIRETGGKSPPDWKRVSRLLNN